MSTAIEWTDESWNPVTGCTEVSAGCDNCYARELANRRLADVYLKRAPAVVTPENEANPFAVRLWPERLSKPRSWRDPKMVFVNSMSDMFHADIDRTYVASVFRVMLQESRHIYQVLTKRPGRAAAFWRSYRGYPIPGHIWIGTSVENQDMTYRVGQLRGIPAAVRFLSCEPLLGPLDLDLEGIHWVIVGGESGNNYRPMNLDYARSIRDQCLEAEVPFFFKQVGGRTPKAGGCELDGREWKQFPESAGAPGGSGGSDKSRILEQVDE